MTDAIQVAFGPLEKFTERKVKGIILGVAANITEDMPVDTGHAANNVVVSIGKPNPAIDGSNAHPSSSAQAAGLAEAARYKLPQLGYVNMNPDYIGLALNKGSSPQAPSGFIQAAALRAVREEASKE